MSHDMCVMLHEEYLAIKIILGNYPALFEGVHEGACFPVLLLPNETVPAQ